MLLKRTLDLIIALVVLIIFSPLLMMILIVSYIKLGSPVIFIQDRVGLHGRIFKIYKFRTMSGLRDEEGTLLPDEERISLYGKILRATSLDELPELINVIKGDMSLVGPRPLLVEYLPLYSDYQLRRHEIRPGITGWAQINGRNSLQWSERFEYDVWYVDNWSLMLDIKIILLTILKVIMREGVSQEGHVSSEDFKGNADNHDQHIEA